VAADPIHPVISLKGINLSSRETEIDDVGESDGVSADRIALNQ